jgi:sialate O-acetylesterase
MSLLKGMLLFCSCLLLGFNAFADVTLPNVIGNNMVIQRNKPIIIWGKADQGENVTVQFANQSQTTTTNADGKWSVTLKAVKASDKPAEMIIKGNNTIKLENILVGEVWVCTGQSNMEYRLDRSTQKMSGPKSEPDLAQTELRNPKPVQIRYLYVEKKNGPPDIVTKGWTNGNDTIVRYVSAVGYFFAKEIYDELKVPIGIISTSWGGTRIEEWTPAKAYQESKIFQSQTQTPNFKIDGMTPGIKFQGMLAPIIPFAVKGFLWYQGESNCMIHDSLNYADKFKLMIDTWRNLWDSKEMPIYTVQVAPYLYTARKDKLQHTVETLPVFWEAQQKCLQIPNTGMAVVTDLVDNFSNIHPWNKWDVAHRLAVWALAKEYDKKIEYSGPVYKKMKMIGDKIYLKFDHVGNGLISKDGRPLNWFTIAGPDGKFVKANAVIEKNKVVVSSPEVKSPVNVRFGWNEIAQPNFFNSNGLPASPFRTDSPEWIPSE